jgi:hypothetical protein
MTWGHRAELTPDGVRYSRSGMLQKTSPWRWGSTEPSFEICDRCPTEFCYQNGTKKGLNWLGESQ